LENLSRQLSSTYREPIKLHTDKFEFFANISACF